MEVCEGEPERATCKFLQETMVPNPAVGNAGEEERQT